MSVETILQQLEEEIQKLPSARALLTGNNGTSAKIASVNGTRTLSVSARRKMAAAQKARWAKFRATKGQTTAKPTLVQPRLMSAAGRKRIAAAQRARWAKLKATKKTSQRVRNTQGNR